MVRSSLYSGLTYLLTDGLLNDGFPEEFKFLKDTWISIDLFDTYTVFYLYVLSKTCERGHFKNFVVSLTNYFPGKNWLSIEKNICNTVDKSFMCEDFFTILCKKGGVVGRYVTLEQDISTTAQLSLKLFEVEVYGNYFTKSAEGNDNLGLNKPIAASSLYISFWSSHFISNGITDTLFHSLKEVHSYYSMDLLSFYRVLSMSKAVRDSR